MAKTYFKKMRGTGRSAGKICGYDIFWSWFGSFLGISAVAYFSHQFLDGIGLTLLIGSFGASAVLIYSAIDSPLAQPRNLIGGHVLSALIGVACRIVFADAPEMAAAMAVSLAIAVMLLTRTLHPPGGATALIAVIGGEEIYALGFLYAAVPVGVGALLMLVIALLVNNISSQRSYPKHWL